MSKLSKLLVDPSNNDFYLIGEVAYNHEGSLSFCLETIDALSKHQVDAIKLHLLIDIYEYMTPSNGDHDLRKKWLWSKAQYHQVMDSIKRNGKEIIALADDSKSVDLILERGDVAGIEIHAVCLNCPKMLEAVAKFDGPIFLGIGGTELDEIKKAVGFLKQKGRDQIILMYGIQTYPTELDKVNLKKMQVLKNLTHCEIGYADHTAWDHPKNELVSTLAYTQGFRILEKHYTHQGGKDRIDFQAAIGDVQMKNLIQYLQTIRECMGNGSLELNDAELKYGSLGPMKKVMVASRKLKKGDIIEKNDISLKRSGQTSNVRQSDYELALGKSVNRDIEVDEVIFKEDFVS